MTNVINLFGDEPERRTAVDILRERADELDAEDEFTDCLIITYGEDGLAIKTNTGGLAEANIMIDMVKQQLVTMLMFGEDDGEYDD
jgi:hypothetical protein